MNLAIAGYKKKLQRFQAGGKALFGAIEESNVVFLLDASESMGKKGLATLCTELQDAIENQVH